MNARLAGAVSAGKLTAWALHTAHRGGTALPGLVAERVDPRVAERLAGQLERGSALITGTNGKTTTARMLSSMAGAAGVPVLHNREGSNLMRGVVSALLGETSPGGRLRPKAALGIFEVDEAAMPAAGQALAPRTMTFTNLFRDQLDRYGEVDTVFALWREAAEAAGERATLVLNADDPSVAELALAHGGGVAWFGIDEPGLHSEAGGASDARWCRVCGGSFEYELRYFAHVGHWRCGGCGRQREAPGTVATDLRVTLDGARFAVAGLGEVEMRLTGLYNVYNALAAVATARALGFPGEAIVAGLRDTEPAFGRQESVDLDGRLLRIMLTKNPAGANQVLRLLAAVGLPELNLGLMLNDRHADGRDVSWIWDVDYELLSGRAACWVAGGDRAHDMALRLGYAGWRASGGIHQSPGALLDALLAAVPRGGEIFLLPTYTAMLDLREELVRRGVAARFWES